MKKQITVITLILTVAGAGFLLTNQAFANGNSPWRSGLIQKLSEKFKLNKDEVQKVFDEERVTRQNEMNQKLDDRLTQAVDDGKITEDQKKLILAKLKELHDEKQQDFENFKNMTPQQRRAEMQSHRQDLEKWAQDNGIDLTLLRGGFGRGFRGDADRF